VAEVTEIELWRSLQSVLRGYRSAQVVLACNELGVFEALTPGARTAVEVATKLGSEPESTRRLLDAAVALGLHARAQADRLLIVLVWASLPVVGYGLWQAVAPDPLGWQTDAAIRAIVLIVSSSCDKST
jgi:hypothetical protein